MHRGARADHLVAALADILVEPAGDVFAPEWVAVHSRGIERWISQQLSHRLGAGPAGDGVAAGLTFPFPLTVVDRVVAAALDEPVPTRDPWDAGALTFTLVDLVDRGEVDLGDLGAFGVHLAGSRFRRLPALRHAAVLLDRYQQHRPDLVTAWVGWDGTGPLPDGRDGALPDRLRWQAVLLRAARATLGETRVERMDRAVTNLHAGAGRLPGVPDRVLLFSLTAVASAHLRVLDALSTRHDVHAFVLHPSPRAWEHAARALAATDISDQPRRRPVRAASTLPPVAHPLLERWARDSRELQVVLAGRGRDRPTDLDPPADRADGLAEDRADGLADDRADGLTDGSRTPAPTTLLARVQADVRGDLAPGVDAEGRPAPWRLDPRDRSLQVHAAHGQIRQVEVARDAILHALAEDPTLEPRDVVVMTPDVETHAPLVDAAFRAAAGPDSGLPDLRVRVADRALRTANPLLSALADLLDLADSRLEAGPVLELLRRDPVRRRFGLAEDDVDQLDRLLADAGVRWGLDGDHRARFRVPTAVNTWRFGLDRLLAGMAIGSGTIADEVLADDRGGDQPSLVGRLSEFVARLHHLVDRMVGIRGVEGDEGADDPGHPVEDWVAILRDAADLLTEVDEDDAWQRWQLDRLLEDLAARAGGVSATVTLRELRGMLADDLGGRPTRADHQTGDLTVCTLVPMRSVPFRVVVVLGLDDGAFPRHRVPSGDDVMGLEPLVGDRDPRTEDRQLLLDALLSARDRFVVTYRGADERTNQEVPPSVVVAELLDVVSATADTADGDDAANVVHVRHTLRAADARNFSDEAAGDRAFDRVALDGARAAAGPPTVPALLCTSPPTDVPDPPDLLTVPALVSILSAPTRSWLQHVFGFRDRTWEDARDDNLTVEATGLGGWSLGEALLRGLIAGEEPAERLRTMRREGVLPVGRLAENAVASRLPMAVTIADATHRLRTDLWSDAIAEEDVEVDLDLGAAGLRGVVAVPAGGVDLRPTYSSARAGQLVGGWIPHLVRSALGHPTRLVVVAKHNDKAVTKAAVSHVFEPLDPPRAQEVLADLVVVARRLLVHPVPFFTNTSGAYWRARVDGKEDAAALGAAGGSWSAGYRTKWGEGHDPNVERVFGTGSLVTLVNAGRAALDDAPAWWDDEPHELARWARRVYDVLHRSSVVAHHARAEVETVVVPA
ncbi:exodeoxyribonuclease V subunit gamma [Salsipaludibacter albus]|uniref:exodeoxyribonuclease V subunit gamma n=1 Tax=Salsipaludibacter albus TaxID=2849650 RepID=UPI001EE40E51